VKITKFVHSCLLVEMPEPVNRTALFDPGMMSAQALKGHAFEYLDDIIITHAHGDHLDVDTIKWLVEKFPDVRITAPTEVVEQLKDQSITATDQASEGIVFFDSPHEVIRPVFDADPPQEIGVHYLDLLSDPGDSHSFTETKKILALPVQAPWGSEVAAIKLGLELKPQHILPIHDWHWNDDARKAEYDRMEKTFAGQGITFHKLETGVPIVIET
jgi:L-ascorbate metabolism protein UlaG (beta-lactamase superfamily)